MAEQIDLKWIESLVNEHQPESQWLDFKRKLPEKSSEGQQEYASDLVAFANAEGGRLVFGIEEDKDGRASRVVGIEEMAEAATQRLQSYGSNYVYPRIQGLRVQPVIAKEGAVVVVEIPKQYSGPFQTHVGTQQRFLVRTGRQRTQMSYKQLSDAFHDADSLQQRIMQWHSDRVAFLRELDHIQTSPWVALHLLPISSFMGASRVDIQLLRGASFDFSGQCLNSRANYDGLVMMLGAPTPSPTEDYVQWFRNGSVEVAWRFSRVGNHTNPLQSIKTSQRMVQTLPRCANLLASLDVVGPCFVLLTMMGVRGHPLSFSMGNEAMHSSAADRDVMMVGPRFVPDLRNLAETPLVFVKEVLDQMFQAFGEDDCPYFDQDGQVRFQEILRYADRR